MKKSGIILLITLGVAAAGAESRHPWGGFKPGSFVRLKSHTVVWTEGRRMMADTEMKQTLIALTAKEAVVETEVPVPDSPPLKKTLRIPLAAHYDVEAGAGRKPLKVSAEDVTVGGRIFHCIVTETEIVKDGVRTKEKSWTSGEMPGRTVRMWTKSPTMETTTEVADFNVR